MLPDGRKMNGDELKAHAAALSSDTAAASPHTRNNIPLSKPVVAPANATGMCAACGAASTKKCARCKAVFYCSPACQRQHWTTGDHKATCVPAAVVAGALATEAGAAAATTAPSPPVESNVSEVAAVAAAAESVVASDTLELLPLRSPWWRSQQHSF